MIFGSFLNLLFPPLCLHCRARIGEGVLCGPCVRAVTLYTALFCGKCGSRLAEGKRVCHEEHPYLLGAAGSYDDPVLKDLIHSLKFNSVRGAAKPLAEFLIRYADSLPVPIPRANTIVIPMPLGKRRRRTRGFNQAELITHPFAEHLGLPLVAHAFARIRHTPPQTEQKRLEERRENMRGAFSVLSPEEIAGKTILLIDDVITSGATLFEAARTLKDGGARRVIALVTARA